MDQQKQRQIQEGKPGTTLIKPMKRRSVEVVGLKVWTTLLLFLMAVDLASWHGALVWNEASVLP